MLNSLYKDLNLLKNPFKAQTLQWFFKTWPGQYGEWDIFLWITVPELRNLVKKYINLSIIDIEKLIYSEIHEHRYMALAIIKLRYEKPIDDVGKEELFTLALKHIWQINNWDLVDTFAPYVFWDYLFKKDKTILYNFTKLNSLWERRISIISTYYFIKKWEFEDTLKICELLLWDKQDLIHKACGWMLREIWKVDEKVLCSFLEKYYRTMPRTMLRYAIERLDISKKKYYMQK